MRYAQHLRLESTPQSEPLPGQVANSAGGHAYAVDEWTRLDRFLVLGSEGGSYYASERTLTRENAKAVEACVKADGQRAVRRIVEVSVGGRAPKNDPAIFALAMALKLGDEDTRRAAAAVVPQVCRIGTHLFQLAEAVKVFGGWGRTTARAFASWYEGMRPDRLALQAVKYQQRGGWSHRDLLRKSHPRPSEDRAALLRWMSGASLDERTVKRIEAGAPLREDTYGAVSGLPRIVDGFLMAREATEAHEIVQLIVDYDLPRECIPTEHLNSLEVWEALLCAGRGMPLTAMVRNLGKMTAIGLLAPLSEATRYVTSALSDAEAIRQARVHPMALLVAQRTYAQGRGDKGKLSWSPVQPIVAALDAAFYTAFDNVAPTGKRWLLALDVSGSMTTSNIAGMPLTPREASGAMALVTMRTEEQHHVVGFTAGGRNATAYRTGGMWGGSAISELPLSRSMGLNGALQVVGSLPFSGTDCALPMLYATQHRIPVDVFTVYTDSETWAGGVHPVVALKQYRQKMGIDAKLIVCGMVSNGFSIADPNDGGSLDVVGFDTQTPAVMAEFARGGF